VAATIQAQILHLQLHRGSSCSCNYTGTAPGTATIQGHILHLQLHRDSSCNYTGMAPAPLITQQQLLLQLHKDTSWYGNYTGTAPAITQGHILVLQLLRDASCSCKCTRTPADTATIQGGCCICNYTGTLPGPATIHGRLLQLQLCHILVSSCCSSLKN
jgi:hypothetical protein